MSSKTEVSVICPCYNEEGYIAGFVQNLRDQDFPSEKIEFLILDGKSEDKTLAEFNQAKNGDQRFQLITNEQKTVPYAMNKGIEMSRGEIIVRMDIHASYPANYISTLVNSLKQKSAQGIGNVGCCIQTQPANLSLKAQAIATAVSSIFGVGGATFRTGTKEERLVDTVPFGCYYKKTLQDLGLYDLRLTRSQDAELNARLLKSGEKILLVPNLSVEYYARDTYKKLWRMYFQYGHAKILVGKLLGKPANLRQFAPPAVVAALALSVILSAFTFKIEFLLISFMYLLALAVISISTTLKRNKPLFMIPHLIWSFLCLHISYGLGQFKGFWNFIIQGQSEISKKASITR